MLSITLAQAGVFGCKFNPKFFVFLKASKAILYVINLRAA
ncbi:hypothetical protein UNSWCS_1806 [Campylobacter concisus UNSWCS]|uniref:Uncharacterized protein n=1 Tax=Campylobacter concisus UNSWCS TaxID=1242968 RepID=U2GRS3_9BACT|nr:hypothetical protein UNSWCS_1806 [Campylobacter concisus UNSWCS]